MIIRIWTHLSTHRNTYTRTHCSLLCCTQEPREPDNSRQMKPAYDPPNVDEDFQLSSSCLKRSPVAIEQNFSDPLNIEQPQSAQEYNLRNTQICTRNHKVCTRRSLLNIHFVNLSLIVWLFSHMSFFLQRLGILKQILKMCLVIVMGPLMFWLATDQADWLSQISFF